MTLLGVVKTDLQNEDDLLLYYHLLLYPRSRRIALVRGHQISETESQTVDGKDNIATVPQTMPTIRPCLPREPSRQTKAVRLTAIFDESDEPLVPTRGAGDEDHQSAEAGGIDHPVKAEKEVALRESAAR